MQVLLLEQLSNGANDEIELLSEEEQWQQLRALVQVIVLHCRITQLHCWLGKLPKKNNGKMWEF